MGKLIADYKTTNDNLGCITAVEHEIELPGTPKGRCQNYTVPFKLQDKGKNLIEDLENERIVSRTIYSLASPAFLIIKKGSEELRRVIDYREMNKVTIRQDFPIPKIN